mgnify:CR=1 FL=1
MLCTALSACFKDEAPNAECDIEAAFVSVDQATDVFNNLSDTLVAVPSTSTDIVFAVKRKSQRTQFAPQFKLTPGATIVPANGSVHDFSSQPVVYTVTSEDKSYHRIYRVSFKKDTVMVGDTVKFDFENVVKDNLPDLPQFYKWQEKGPDGIRCVGIRQCRFLTFSLG